ncbi:glycine betaine/L-proline ABC transporter ATP-binding protein ProV [Bacillus alveayuensis]|jgi:glycine betaine/proline transport system ATP-binding protein|uniref:glycine betaine/L-proline ABC transporter ATP-binding protein ProV n=1 Tax=Aeribacillus alveayuensis TaxID=279215 RepID=UPI0005D11664|nr:glycine betaine/L-proline ABC transporter ATP-binding protein ProV [Bacillus alveayuensis]
MDIQIQVENVSKIFGKHPKKAMELLKQGKTKEEILQKTGMTVGVNQANFTVYKGEIFVIMGLSGSGKSTLVRMLNRLIEPTFGHVYIDGEDIVTMKDEKLRDIRRKKVSMVFQRFALFPHKTVLENTAYGLEVQGIEKKEREKKAKEALQLVGLQGYENSFPSELSGGMQQRVGLARALSNDPDLLLMDEAFSALDPLIRKDMQDELLELQESMHKTIVFITHDLDEALRIGDRIALMKDGSIVQIGTPEEIMTNPSNDYVKRFVEDVNLSKVLTAESIMTRAKTITIDRGPRVALQLMKDESISSVYVMDKKKTFIGILTADDVTKAIKAEKPIADFIQTNLPAVQTDTVLEETFNKLMQTRFPLPVVDEKNRLKGIIKRENVIEVLAGIDQEEVKANE